MNEPSSPSGPDARLGGLKQEDCSAENWSFDTRVHTTFQADKEGQFLGGSPKRQVLEVSGSDFMGTV